jgi:hypothetical protein
LENIKEGATSKTLASLGDIIKTDFIKIGYEGAEWWIQLGQDKAQLSLLVNRIVSLPVTKGQRNF